MFSSSFHHYLIILIPVLSFIYFYSDLLSIKISSKTNEETIKQLFNRSSDLKLSKNVIFVTADQQELPAIYLIDLIKDEEFSKFFQNELTHATRIEITEIKSNTLISILK